MKSMTGYGRGQAPCPGGSIGVEIRTVNHRYLDVKVASSGGRLSVMSVVEQRVRTRLSRGRVEVSIVREGLLPSPTRVAAVAETWRSLDRIRRDLGTADPIDLGALWAAVAEEASVPAADEGIETAAAAATDAALDQVEAMRTREGEALRRLIEAGTASLERLAGELSGAAERVRAAIPERIRQRLEVAMKAAEAGTLDSDRLALEVAMALDRSDVTEEADRLGVHVAHLREAIAADGGVGRRAEFLLQEIVREASTLGAKSQDAAVSRMVADMRVAAEQVREQVLNVE